MDYPDSQPFFTEDVTESQPDVKRKKYSESDEGIYDESQSILLPTIIRYTSKTDTDSGSVLAVCGTQEKEIISDKEDKELNDNADEILCEKEDEVISDDDIEKESEKDKLKTTSSTCVFCMFDKDLDKRNYYFGNLLIGELQFLPPCMRSEAYMKILELIDSLKHKHRSKVYDK